MVTIVQGGIQNALSYSRVNRAPQHQFNIEHRPFQITPFMIAPVLPNETFKNALLQARVVTDPIKNPLIGWWIEYHWFYVKHRDLVGRDDFVNMMLQPGYDMSAYTTAADVLTYHNGGGINWIDLCVSRIVQTWFRDDEGDDHNALNFGGYHTAQIKQNSWLDSVVDTTLLDDGADPGDASSAEGLDLMMQQWELMRSMQMTDMSYEDWLATYGVRKQKTELHQPERIRSVSQWSYPSNTVDPATGAPSSAVSWSIAERADKDRHFREPGFVVGLTIARPKVYLNKQTASAVNFMDNAMNWLPALMADQPHTSLKEFSRATAASGPLGTNPTNGYWVDMRDLLIYGDQFINFAVTETDNGLVALPTPAMQKRYPSAADADALFKNASPANKIRQDGICALTIAGTQRDTTGGHADRV